MWFPPMVEPCGLDAGTDLEALGKRLKLSAKAMEVVLLFYLFEVERKAADFLSGTYDLQRSTGRRALATALAIGAGELQDILDGDLLPMGVLYSRRPYHEQLCLSDLWLPFLGARARHAAQAQALPSSQGRAPAIGSPTRCPGQLSHI